MELLHREMDVLKIIRKIEDTPTQAIIAKIRRQSYHGTPPNGFVDYLRHGDDGSKVSEDVIKEVAPHLLAKLITSEDFYTTDWYAQSSDQGVAVDIIPKQVGDLCTMTIIFEILMMTSNRVQLWDGYRRLFGVLVENGYTFEGGETFEAKLLNNDLIQDCKWRKKLLDTLVCDQIAKGSFGLKSCDQEAFALILLRRGLTASLHNLVGRYALKLNVDVEMYASPLPADSLFYLSAEHPQWVKASDDTKGLSFTACITRHSNLSNPSDTACRKEALIRASAHIDIWEQLETYDCVDDFAKILAASGSGRELITLGGWQAKGGDITPLEAAIADYYERSMGTPDFTSTRRSRDQERLTALLEAAQKAPDPDPTAEFSEPPLI